MFCSRAVWFWKPGLGKELLRIAIPLKEQCTVLQSVPSGWTTQHQNQDKVSIGIRKWKYRIFIRPTFHKLYPSLRMTYKFIPIFLVEFQFLHDFFINGTKKWKIQWNLLITYIKGLKKSPLNKTGRTLKCSLVRWHEETHQEFLRSINLNTPVNVGTQGDAG